MTPFKFYNCFSLDRDAQKIIIQSNPIMAVMPGGEVPMYFTHRASGSSLSILLSESSLSQEYIIIKACIVVGPSKRDSLWCRSGCVHVRDGSSGFVHLAFTNKTSG